MNKGLVWAVGVPLMWLSAVLDQGVVRHMTVFGARPHFLLISAVILSLLSRPGGGAFTGFVSALLQGVISGANLASYVLSRVITGFTASATRMMGIEFTLPVIFAIMALATFEAQILLMFLAPPPSLLSFVGATIGEAIYNGVLAMPMYALVRRLVGVSSRYY